MMIILVGVYCMASVPSAIEIVNLRHVIVATLFINAKFASCKKRRPRISQRFISSTSHGRTKQLLTMHFRSIGVNLQSGLAAHLSWRGGVALSRCPASSSSSVGKGTTMTKQRRSTFVSQLLSRRWRLTFVGFPRHERRAILGPRVQEMICESLLEQ